MKALSVRAPWWCAILRGKPVENRDWATHYRGRVWLHASGWWNATEIADDWDCMRAMAAQDGLAMLLPSMADLHRQRGCIVGSVEIVDCVTSHPSAFFVGKFGFVLRNPSALVAGVRCKGALGFFDVPPEIEAACGVIADS